MSVRFDNATDRLLRTTDLIDYTSVYTWMAWIYLSVDTNAISTIFAISRDTGNVDDLRTAADGTTLTIRSRTAGVGGAISGSSISIGTWYHISMVRDSSTSLKLYLNGVLDAEGVVSSVGRDAPTRMELGAEFVTDSNPMNGRVTAIKAWSSNLSQIEVFREMFTVLPKRLTDVYGYWPCLPGATERLRDYSVNVRNWTASGTLTDEVGSTPSWGIYMPTLPLFVVSGNFSFTDTNNLAITPISIDTISVSINVSDINTLNFTQSTIDNISTDITISDSNRPSNSISTIDTTQLTLSDTNGLSLTQVTKDSVRIDTQDIVLTPYGFSTRDTILTEIFFIDVSTLTFAIPTISTVNITNDVNSIPVTLPSRSSDLSLKNRTSSLSLKRIT